MSERFSFLKEKFRPRPISRILYEHHLTLIASRFFELRFLFFIVYSNVFSKIKTLPGIKEEGEKIPESERRDIVKRSKRLEREKFKESYRERGKDIGWREREREEDRQREKREQKKDRESGSLNMSR